MQRAGREATDAELAELQALHQELETAALPGLPNTDQFFAINERFHMRLLEIANNRYKAGLVTYLDVITEQTQALSVEQTAVQLQGERLTATVNLIKALGAGWGVVKN